MARVVEEEPVKEKRTVCDHCGLTIAYVKNDVQEHNYTDYGGGPSGCHLVKCPNTSCGKDIILRSW